MLFPCCGCAAGDAVETGESTGPVIETTAGPEYTAPEIIDFDGYEYRIYAYEDGYGYLGSFAVEEDKGDTVVSAIYNRNLKVEDMYNVTIGVTVKTDVMTRMQKCAISGDDFADLTSYCIRWQYQNSLYESAANLLNIETLRLESPWWDQDFNNEFTVNGILQSSVGDIIGTDEVCTTAYLYNKRIFEEIGRTSDELYGAVEKGEWTVERLVGYCNETTADINGFRSILGNLSSTQKDTFVSSAAKIQEQVGVKLDKFMEHYASLAAQ